MTQADLHCNKSLKHACKVDCDVKSEIDPLPFWLSRETNDAWFFVSFEANKMAGFILKKGKKAAIRFKQVHRFILTEKIFWG